MQEAVRSDVTLAMDTVLKSICIKLDRQSFSAAAGSTVHCGVSNSTL